MEITTEDIEIPVTDLIEKKMEDLSDDEKAQILKELTIYSLSDSYAALAKDLNAKAEAFLETIEDELENSGRNKEATTSMCDREYRTAKFMEEIIGMIDESIGGKVFKSRLERGAKQYRNTILTRIEQGYDFKVFTELDALKNERCLVQSVRMWLSQAIVSYEKNEPAEQEGGAF